jgi:hypothetical protein
MTLPELVLSALTSQWNIPVPEIVGTNQTYPTRTLLTVKSEIGTFAVKVDSQPSSDNSANVVLPFLQARRFPHSPRIFPTRNGHYSLILDSAEVTVLEYIPHQLAAAESWTALGMAAARLNQIQDFPFPYVVNPQGAFDELTQWCTDQTFADEFSAILASIRPSIDSSANKSSATPCIGLVHGEINLANARRRHNGEIVLLDWDEAGFAPIELELGYPLITIFMDETTLAYDAASARKFYHAYDTSEFASSLNRDCIWAFGLLHALRSLTWYNTAARWARVQRAIELKDDILRSCSLHS